MKEYQNMVEVEEVKKKVIGKTFYNNDALVAINGNTFKDVKKNRTSLIIEYYFPILRDRCIELFKKYIYTDYLNKDNYYWKYSYEKAEDDSHEKFEFKFQLMYNYKEMCPLCFAQFNMQETGNCCGSMTIFGIRLQNNPKHSYGIGKLILAMAEDIAIAQGTSNLMCINIQGRGFTEYLLKDGGFKKIHDFHNRNTGNTCYIMSKELLNEHRIKEIISKDLD